MQELQTQSVTINKIALPLKSVIGIFTVLGNKFHNSLYGSLSWGPVECLLMESNFISSCLVQSAKPSIPLPQKLLHVFQGNAGNLKECLCNVQPTLLVMRVENVLRTKM